MDSSELPDAQLQMVVHQKISKAFNTSIYIYNYCEYICICEKCTICMRCGSFNLLSLTTSIDRSCCQSHLLFQGDGFPIMLNLTDIFPLGLTLWKSFLPF